VPRDRAIWKLVAFAARYGSTDPKVALGMPASQLTAFTMALGELLEEEAEAVRNANRGT
jgi:hypothetical protein